MSDLGTTRRRTSEEPSGHHPSTPGRPHRLGRSVLLVTAIALPLVFAVFAVNSFFGRGGVDSPGIGAADFTARGAPEARPAPDFTLRLLNGEGSVRLDDFAGKVLVLNVWASWCGPCRQEAPVLEGMWHRYRALGVRFLGVDHMDARAAGLAFQRHFAITYPSAFDPGGTLARRYRAVGIPTTFVVDRTGTIVYRFLGRLRGPDLSSILDEVVHRTSSP